MLKPPTYVWVDDGPLFHTHDCKSMEGCKTFPTLLPTARDEGKRPCPFCRPLHSRGRPSMRSVVYSGPDVAGKRKRLNPEPPLSARVQHRLWFPLCAVGLFFIGAASHPQDRGLAGIAFLLGLYFLIGNDHFKGE